MIFISAMVILIFSCFLSRIYWSYFSVETIPPVIKPNPKSDQHVVSPCMINTLVKQTGDENKELINSPIVFDVQPNSQNFIYYRMYGIQLGEINISYLNVSSFSSVYNHWYLTQAATPQYQSNACCVADFHIIHLSLHLFILVRHIGCWKRL